MSETFDPYHRWLGIPLEDQPPHHYRLFGVNAFESDLQVIDAVSSRHIEFLRQIQDGPHVDQARQLLQELVAARECLLDPSRKQAYDEQLHAQMQTAPIAARPSKPPRKQPPFPAPPPPVLEPADPPPVREPTLVDPPIRMDQFGDLDTSGSNDPSPSHSVLVPDPDPIGVLAPKADAGQVGTALIADDAQAASPAASTTVLRALRTQPRRTLAVAGTACVLLVGIFCLIGWLGGRREDPPQVQSAAERSQSFADLASSGVDAPDTPPDAQSPDTRPPDAVGTEADRNPVSSGLPVARLNESDVDHTIATPGPGPLPEPPVSFATQGVLLWLDANALTATDAVLDHWPDRSPFAWNINQERSSDRPLLVPAGLNGRPIMRFAGQQWLEISGSRSDFDPAAEYTIVFVARGSQGIVLSKGACSGRTSGLTLGPGHLSVGGSEEPDNLPLRPAADDPAQFRVRTIVARGDRVAWFSDGRLAGTSEVGMPFGRSCNLRIGAAYFRADASDDASFLHGDLAELLVFNRPLDDETRWQVERYLQDKWLPDAQLASEEGNPNDSLEPDADNAGVRPDGPANRSPTSTEMADNAAEREPGDAAMPAAVAATQPGFALGSELPLAPTGSINRAVWFNFHGDGPDDIRAFIASHPDPEQNDTLDRFASPEDAADDYCQRIWGCLQPPASGTYRLELQANKAAVVYVSSDQSADNLRLIDPDTDVYLEQGRAYAIEVLHWETTGKDYLRLGWTRPDGTQQMPIPGEVLATQAQLTPACETGFVTLQPIQAQAAGTELAVQDDGQIVVGDATPAGSEYRVLVELDMPRLTGLRLEALPHPSLPGGGPGLATDGMFRLAEIQASVVPDGVAAQPRMIRWREAVVQGDPGASRLVDGEPGSFWKPLQAGQPISVLLLPAAPLSFERPVRLAVTLSNRDNLGCFRLSATAMAQPRNLPDEVQPDAAAGDPPPLLVNLGGGDYTDRDGNQWLASRDFDGQTYGHEGGSNVISDVVVNDLLYGTQRRSLTAFRAVVPDGIYYVALLFRETATLDPTRRTFTVQAESRNVPPVPFRGPGMGANYVHEIHTVVVRDGRLDIDFFPQPDSLSMLNGIVIRKVK